jgi:cadmium resistance protein CadD (predicted permease)
MLGTSIVNFLLGGFTETEIVLLFGICLVILTIGIRWFLKRHEQPSEDKTNEIVKR